MPDRFTDEHVETWRREGAVMLPEFFTPNEIAAVTGDFELVFPDRQGGHEALVKKKAGEIGAFNQAQFKNFENIPFDCSPALNLLCVHPALVELARSALHTREIQLYQSQAWAKFTGEADFEQLFHCDFGNHTLTVPSEDECANSITFLIYFTDVTEDHGPTHYVTKTDSTRAGVPAATFSDDLDLQDQLRDYERTTAAPAGSIFAYGIDVYHRGTNLTVQGGYRYAVTSCFKKAGNEAIGYMAWQFQHTKPWHRIFDHATPDQLGCFGVPKPGDSFWTEQTLIAAQLRYPNWDMSPYKDGLY
ncbi:MAG: phytanoyl-CoA dioxygenase family protein [Gammaproteobacteria bacterium]|nr:phytanoyl-CoA dioxygenase family protein [Gammaproteobacteria bacterium]